MVDDIMTGIYAQMKGRAGDKEWWRDVMRADYLG